MLIDSFRFPPQTNIPIAAREKQSEIRYSASLDAVIGNNAEAEWQAYQNLRQRIHKTGQDIKKWHLFGATLLADDWKSISLSGRLDSNQRPPTPEAGALTGLRYTPNKCPYRFKSAQR